MEMIKISGVEIEFLLQRVNEDIDETCFITQDHYNSTAVINRPPQKNSPFGTKI